jgi:AcrR family transcriptional regulator
MNARLTKPDWIAHGLQTLEIEGAYALKVGPMSTKLKVSRGSFYWHFRDIADFRAQILQNWQETSTDQIIQEIASKAGPDRLKNLMRRAFFAKRSLDRAIRAWAAEDKTVAAVVASVDERRVEYIAKLLIGTGVESKTATARAAFMYWAYLGQAVVMDQGNSSITVLAMDDISDLFER